MFKPTFNFKAFRVSSVDIVEHADDVVKITVTASRVMRKQELTFDFFVGHGRRASASGRFQALMSALGVRRQPEDADEMVGRYFAVKDGGRQPEDFATLEYASACLRCDREHERRVQVYLAEYAAEEAAGLAA